MPDLLPDLSSLPPWAQLICYVVFAITLGGGGGVLALGVRRGREGSTAAPQMQIAGALISDAAAKDIIAALDGNGTSNANAAAAAKELSATLSKHTDVVERVTDKIDEARQDIRELRSEIIRNSEVIRAGKGIGRGS